MYFDVDIEANEGDFRFSHLGSPISGDERLPKARVTGVEFRRGRVGRMGKRGASV